MQRPILSVSEVTRYIKDILSNNIILSNVLIRGEISNFKNHYSGHLYFTLKDAGATLKCVMFKASCMTLKFDPADGMKVIVQGRISVYERDGSYQLYVDDMQPDGLGALHLAFEQLKTKLELEGLFDQARKKSIPPVPNAIGIVTSPTGAAIKDMLNVLNRRFSNIKVIIFPVQVQGDGACNQIADAIDTFNQLKNVDVIIIGRGGGSIEELWAFNEEVVARSIANSKIPIISAVGHETDFTIADFVSDLRAPTPSAAAELVIPNKIDIQATLESLQSRLKYAIQNTVYQKQLQLENLQNCKVFNQPLDNIFQYRIRIDILVKNMIKEIKYIFEKKNSSFGQQICKLSVLSPLDILKRGYSISTIDSKVVKSVSQIKSNDKIKVQYTDGVADCTVVNVVKGELK